MFITESLKVTISNNGSYYESKGYGTLKQRDKIIVKIEDLPFNCNKIVKCRCDDCMLEFERQLQLLNKMGVHRCRKCSMKNTSKIRDYTNVIKNNQNNIGEKHPRFDHKKSEYAKYKGLVAYYTNKQNLSLLENSDKPRGLAGTPGNYQLDHMVSVRYGFDNNIPPEIIGDISNLRFIPWEENLSKGMKCVNKIIIEQSIERQRGT